MKQRTICKTLAVAVILLFIGVGINPAVATVQIDEDTFIIQKIKTQIEGLKNKLETIEKDENKLSKLNPVYEEKFQKLYEKITVIEMEINRLDLSDDPFLEFLFFVIVLISYILSMILAWLFTVFILLPLWAIIFIILDGIPGGP
jgi:hypothetical protein